MRILPPILLHYYITYRCNCRCTFCDIWRISEFKDCHYANLADVFNNLKQARDLGVKFVDFTGGEPLLHPHLAQMLFAAKKLRFKTSVTTNCLDYPQRAHDIRGMVDFLHFSIDGGQANVHDKMRGCEAFCAVERSIDLALELGEKPDLIFTVSQENIDQLEMLSELADALKLMLIVNPVFAHLRNRKLSNDDLEYVEAFAKKHYVYVNKAMLKLHRNGGNDKNRRRCRVLDSTIVISPDNNLLLPCFHFAQKRIHLSCALKEIRQSGTFKSIRDMQGRFDFCDGCNLNCYFDPSFCYKIDYYFFASLAAKFRYAWYKYIRRPIELKNWSIFVAR